MGREDSGAEHRGRVETRWCSAHEKRDHIRRGVGTPERAARLQVETDRRFHELAGQIAALAEAQRRTDHVLQTRTVYLLSTELFTRLALPT